VLEVLENNRYRVTPRADADTKRWRPALTAVTGGVLSTHDDIDRICGDHENLIKVILEEEETLMSKHRKHIDDVVDIIKQDMGILQQVEEP